MSALQHLKAILVMALRMALVSRVTPVEVPSAICSSWSMRTSLVSIAVLVVVKAGIPMTAIALFTQ